MEWSGDTTVVEADVTEAAQEEDMDVEEQAAGDVQPTALLDLNFEMQADSTKQVTEQLATVVRGLETPEGVRELRRMSTELAQSDLQSEVFEQGRTEQPAATRLLVEGETSDVTASAAEPQVEKSGKVVEDMFASPADA